VRDVVVTLKDSRAVIGPPHSTKGSRFSWGHPPGTTWEGGKGEEEDVWNFGFNVHSTCGGYDGGS
jgi:hypothetical protein